MRVETVAEALAAFSAHEGLQPDAEVSAENPKENVYQGGVIFDPLRRVVYVSPAAEEFLGWRNEDLVGKPCQSIFDCRDSVGDSLCTRCGLKASLDEQQDAPGMLARVADTHGVRHEVNTTFLYLDPARYSWGARVIGVFRALGSLPHLLPNPPAR